jgi:hypothetical protein
MGRGLATTRGLSSFMGLVFGIRRRRPRGPGAVRMRRSACGEARHVLGICLNGAADQIGNDKCESRIQREECFVSLGLEKSQ